MSLPTSFIWTWHQLCLLLTASHTLLFSFTGLLYHFPKSFCAVWHVFELSLQRGIPVYHTTWEGLILLASPFSYFLLAIFIVSSRVTWKSDFEGFISPVKISWYVYQHYLRLQTPLKSPDCKNRVWLCKRVCLFIIDREQIIVLDKRNNSKCRI